MVSQYLISATLVDMSSPPPPAIARGSRMRHGEKDRHGMRHGEKDRNNSQGGGEQCDWMDNNSMPDGSTTLYIALISNSICI